MEAYVSHLGAIFMMEGKQHQEALDNLIRCKIIYEKISQYKDTIEAVIYEERISQLDTLIRMCCFNLNGMTDPASEKKFIDQQMSAFGGKSKLEEQIAKVKRDTKKEQIENIEEITFNNKSIPLKTEKIKQAFKRFQTSQLEMQQHAESADYSEQL